MGGKLCRANTWHALAALIMSLSEDGHDDDDDGAGDDIVVHPPEYDGVSFACEFVYLYSYT